MTIKTARRELTEKTQELPSLPNGGARLGIHIYQELIEGKRKRNAPYVVNIMDRAPAWILPRYQATFRGSCGYITLQALTWISARISALEAMSEQVKGAILSQRPFRANVPTMQRNRDLAG